MYISAIYWCHFHSTKWTEWGLVTTSISLCVYQCYLLMSFPFNEKNRVRTGNHSHPWCISGLSISIMTVFYHTLDLPNSLSMPLPKEDPWSLSNVLGLFDESESNFSSLASPQGLLKNNSSGLNNSKLVWVSSQMQCCQAKLYGRLTHMLWCTIVNRGKWQRCTGNYQRSKQTG